jgi:basic amino acid/polyamine antiporter, APA family
MSEQSSSFKPSLGLLDATMIVAGSMIGSGIFIVSADMTRNVGSAGWLLVGWLVTGFMTIVAAVSYGELSGMYPKAGGQYVYLKEAYNPLMGFLYGWSFFAVIQTATIAAVGVAFARFSAYIFPGLSENIKVLEIEGFSVSRAQLTSIILIVVLTWINTRGVKEGKIIQTTFTLSKLLALFGLIVFGFLLAKESFWSENWQNAWQARQPLGADGASGWKDIAGITLLGGIAAGMVGSIFSSDSWNNVTFIAGEIKNPKRNIGLSLFLGTFMVTILYVAANLMYLNTLSVDQIAFAQSDRVAVASANNIFGEAGKFVMAVLIMISTFGCNNGLILSGALV